MVNTESSDDKTERFYESLEKFIINSILDDGKDEIANHIEMKKTSRKNNKRCKRKKKINKLKNYNKRKGDWLCPKCNNINFSFRTICNICNITKPINIINNK